jgi:membrane fusion protein, multidrug efflux system
MTLSRSAGAALLTALLILAGTAYALLGAASARGTGNAYVRGDVTPVGTRVTGLVEQVLVTDNQEVRAGDVLFRIDDRDYRARVGEARAALAAKRAELDTLAGRVRLQRAMVEEARASLTSAGAEAERAARELGRIEALRQQGWVTRRQGDEALASGRQAGAAVAAADAALAASREGIAVIESRRPQLLAEIEAAEAALQLALIDLDSTLIRAPADGRVAERQVRRGQYVRPGTQLIALVSRGVWVVANFKETQLRGLRAGERVTVVADALPGRRFEGRVDSLSPASGAQFALLPPGNFTRILQRIPVKIILAPGQPGQAELRPGMSVRVRRTAGNRRG